MAEQDDTFESDRLNAADAARDMGETSDRPSADRDLVARRAFESYEQRGAEHGHDVDDWLDAERELGRPDRESER